jgi:hypothetical protein
MARRSIGSNLVPTWFQLEGRCTRCKILEQKIMTNAQIEINNENKKWFANWGALTVGWNG